MHPTLLQTLHLVVNVGGHSAKRVLTYLVACNYARLYYLLALGNFTPPCSIKSLRVMFATTARGLFMRLSLLLHACRRTWPTNATKTTRTVLRRPPLRSGLHVGPLCKLYVFCIPCNYASHSNLRAAPFSRISHATPTILGHMLLNTVSSTIASLHTILQLLKQMLTMLACCCMALLRRNPIAMPHLPSFACQYMRLRDLRMHVHAVGMGRFTILRLVLRCPVPQR